MIEMLLCEFCLVLAPIGWPGFNQKENVLSTNVTIIWLESRGEESREDRGTKDDSDGGISHLSPGVLVLRSALPKTEFPLSSTCLQRYAGKPGACYLRNIMLINVPICWTFPLPVL